MRPAIASDILGRFTFAFVSFHPLFQSARFLRKNLPLVNGSGRFAISFNFESLKRFPFCLPCGSRSSAENYFFVRRGARGIDDAASDRHSPEQ